MTSYNLLHGVWHVAWAPEMLGPLPFKERKDVSAHIIVNKAHTQQARGCRTRRRAGRGEAGRRDTGSESRGTREQTAPGWEGRALSRGGHGV